MLTRIRNAALARHDRTRNAREPAQAAIAEILKSEGYIADVRRARRRARKTLTIVLKYGRDRTSAIDGIRRVSRPGAASTCVTTASPAFFSGMGVSILSTSRGVMTDKEARRQKVGGELLCEVW